MGRIFVPTHFETFSVITGAKYSESHGFEHHSRIRRLGTRRPPAAHGSWRSRRGSRGHSAGRGAERGIAAVADDVCKKRAAQFLRRFTFSHCCTVTLFGRCRPSQRFQERHQIRFLLLRQIQVEPLIIKFNRVIERRRGAVMEVWRSCCQAAKYRAF